MSSGLSRFIFSDDDVRIIKMSKTVSEQREPYNTNMQHAALSSSEKFEVIRILYANEAIVEGDEHDKVGLENFLLHLKSRNIKGLKAFFEELTNDQIVDFDILNDFVYFGIMDQSRLATIYRLTHVDKKYDDIKPAIISYNPHSGLCLINQYQVKLKNRNKRIFTKIYENVNEQVPKDKIWKAAGQRTTIKTSDDLILFNSYITNLRRALGGIPSGQLRLKKTVELYGITFLTDENDLKLLKYISY